jgi:hypothetical protein
VHVFLNQSQRQGLQQAGLACVILAGDEVDPLERLDAQLPEASEIFYADACEHKGISPFPKARFKFLLSGGVFMGWRSVG